MNDFVYDPPHKPFLQVIYRDNDLLVLNKPAGLLTVPGRAGEHADSLERRAQARFPGARIVHRLDLATSGVIVLARNKAAHRHLGMQFERRHVEKVYVALVWGHLAEDDGFIDLPLICDWPNRPRQMVDFERGRPAQTRWQVLAREGGGDMTERANGTDDGGPPVSRLLLMPTTGRSHQLRVHLAHIGYPILGDRFYAHDHALAAADRLQLHARSLALYHPTGGRRCRFNVPCTF